MTPLERQHDVLLAALRIVTTEGLGALTMQRLADDLQIGVGSLYRFFPSKGALIAELQRESLDLVSTSLRLSQTHITELLEARGVDDPQLASVVRVVGAARFWIGAEMVFPQEIELFRRLFTDPAATMDDEEGARVVPAALRLLELARQALDDAVEVGALASGPNLERAVILVAATTGVLMTSALARWDDAIFDGRRLAGVLVRDLLLGWGAAGAWLEPADDLMAALAERGQLVPTIRR